ncbi:hypothetical protein SAMN04487930_101418 [Cytophaga hutchinsonii ATCC 33406]|jgi:hypothetical protein|nr:hypothetical protein SAMN04487930_101418 [Cytophaga hutchinsonii ATCC 33406]
MDDRLTRPFLKKNINKLHLAHYNQAVMYVIHVYTASPAIRFCS